METGETSYMKEHNNCLKTSVLNLDFIDLLQPLSAAASQFAVIKSRGNYVHTPPLLLLLRGGSYFMMLPISGLYSTE
jgi:hypothetical protein